MAKFNGVFLNAKVRKHRSKFIEELPFGVWSEKGQKAGIKELSELGTHFTVKGTVTTHLAD
ncbi:hypothetical protein NDA01_27470 [Trichocoleus desertorum AS-A10]|uniref:hypothetical protein n=1 Tax=Trichocoleus desertorum TaxID=1481672 RepID=UPI003297DBF8